MSSKDAYKPVSRAGPCLLIALLLLVPLASAGTEADPEVTDATGDSLHADPGRDVAAFWIEDALADVEGAPALAFRLVTAEDFQHNTALFAAHDHFRVDFKAPTVAGQPYVDFRPSNAATGGDPTSESVACRFGVAEDTSSYQDITGEIALSGSVEGNSFTCFLPLEHLGGDAVAGQALTELHVRYMQTFRGPTNAGDQIGTNDSPALDRAPDDGFGRDFVVPSLSSGPLTLYEDAEGVPFSAAAAFANATTVTYQYNWTAPAGDLLLRLDASVAAGNVTVRLVDDGNETRYECACDANRSDEVELSVAEAGNWTLLLEYDGFVGNLTLSIDEAPQAPTGGDDDPDEPADEDGNTTTPDDEDEGPAPVPDEESPLPLWLAVLAVAAVVIARRR